MTEGMAGLLARLSWALPCVGLAALGLLAFAGPLGPAPEVQLAVVAVAVAFGALAAVAALAGHRVRRRAGMNEGATRIVREALLGGGVCVVTLSLLGAGAMAGAADRRRAEAQTESVKSAGRDVVDSAGWYGAVDVDPNRRVFALEASKTSGLAQSFAANFATPFALVVVGASNHGGAPMEIDLSGLEVLFGDGSTRPALDRARVLAGARQSRIDLQRMHGGPYQIVPGQSLSNGVTFLPADIDLARAVALVFRVNGAPIRIAGRHMTAEEKRRAGGP